MKSENEEQTIVFNGKTITLNAENMQILSDLQGKEGLFMSLIDVMKNSSSTTIARSTGENSVNDDEEFDTLSNQFPNATSKKSERV